MDSVKQEIAKRVAEVLNEDLVRRHGEDQIRGESEGVEIIEVSEIAPLETMLRVKVLGLMPRYFLVRVSEQM